MLKMGHAFLVTTSRRRMFALGFGAGASTRLDTVVLPQFSRGLHASASSLVEPRAVMEKGPATLPKRLPRQRFPTVPQLFQPLQPRYQTSE